MNRFVKRGLSNRIAHERDRDRETSPGWVQKVGREGGGWGQMKRT